MGTYLSWLALLIGIAAFGYSWRLQQEIATATRRLDRYNRALFDANDETRRLREDLADLAAQLQVATMQQHADALAFTPKMTVREALILHPQAEQILAGFHLGGCSSCAVDPDETLGQICREQGRDLSQLLQNLNLLLKPQTTDRQLQRPAGQIELVKLPNVEFSFD
ncbi:MAG: hypothetical protein R2867_13460 [Caldilineaceae bacterium]